MTIQIFGTPKCKRTRAAERFFKERKIRVQLVELTEQNLSPGEFDSVKRAVGLEAMIDPSSKEYKRLGLQHLSFDIEEKLKEYPLLLMTPIVRNGPLATVGAQPEIWKAWVKAM
jgi:arsenate reductase-like glutaredoxin family protein